MQSDRTRVAVIGSGNIGIDLCERLLRDDDFEVVALVGRRPDSPGLHRFEGRIPLVTPDGIAGLADAWPTLDGAFDATSAFDHPEHWEIARIHNTWMIDLTPSGIGTPIVPSLIGKVETMSDVDPAVVTNFSMGTCGAQASSPLLFAIAQGSEGIEEVEISSSVASVSVGLATRRNTDHYLEATERLAQLITGCPNAKAILVVNPADPPTMMRTTVTVRAHGFDLDKITGAVADIVSEVQEAEPRYDVVVAPFLKSDDVLQTTVRIAGAGYYLPSAAGNLDIINAAAVATARWHTHRTASARGDIQP